MMKKNPIRLTGGDLPPAARVFWDTAPENFRTASLLTALLCYCCLGTRIRAKYVYDLELHALLLQLLILGEPGSGKSFTRPIVQQLMRQLKLRDKEQKRIELAYKELVKKNSKNQPEEPVTCTRMIQTISRAKLVKRADMFMRKYGEPLAFFFFNEELATMTESNKRAFADLNTLDRLAYDLGAEFGSDTLSDASYNADVDIIYCTLFCGTENALREYLNKRAIEGGNVTRKIIARIDEDMMGADAPRFRLQTSEERAVVDGMVDQLMRQTYGEDDTLQPVHVVDMGWIDDSVRKWCNHQRMEVLKTGSNALNCFYKRSSVSAWRLTVMLYYLWGETEESRSKCIRCYQFLATYILDGLMSKFGRKYDELHKEDAMENEPAAQVSLYDQLPAQFSRDQLRELIVQLKLTSPARVFICKWKKAKLIHQPDKSVDVYVKNY